MQLFLIAATPIAYVYALMLRNETGEPPSRIGASALRGVLAYLIEIVVLLVLTRFIPRVYSGPIAYFHAVLFDFVLPIVASFLLFLWFTPYVRSLSGKERRVSLMSFLAGAYSLAGIMDLFLRSGTPGVYGLFLVPALRISAMLLLPVFYQLFVEETFWVRGFYIAAIIALPFAFAFVFVLTVLNIMYAAIVSTAVVFAAAWLVTFLGALRGGPRS